MWSLSGEMDKLDLSRRIRPGVRMEIRGLGILNIRDLFGVVSIREEKQIELVVQLEEWDPEAEYERLGLDEEIHVWAERNLEFAEFTAPAPRASVALDRTG